MNCYCQPPKPAVTKTVRKEGQNCGRQFFSCESGTCGFFDWVGRAIPMSLNQHAASQGKGQPLSGKNAFAGNSNSSSGGGGGGGSGSSLTAKISIHAIEFKPPLCIWLGLSCPQFLALTRFFSSLPADSARFDARLKMYIFSFVHYQAVVSAFGTAEFRTVATLERLPKFMVQGFQNYLKRLSALPAVSLDQINLTASLQETLKPFQLEGIRFVVSRGGRALIGDEMGCGKTLQAIGVLQHYQEHWPALLIVPVNLMVQWRGEILQYCRELVQEEDVRSVRKATDSALGRIVIIPYSIMDKLVETGKIAPEMFGVVIADESHNLKSIDAKRTVSVVPFLSKAPIAVCLTGTPALNRPVELYTQLNGLVPSFFNDYDQFVRRYCDAKPSRFMSHVLDVRGASNEAELKTILEGLVMIRRLKADVLDKLPTKLRHLKYVDADSNRIETITKIWKKMDFLDAQLKNSSLSDMEKQNVRREKEQLLMKFYQETGLSKIKAIRTVIHDQINEARLERAVELSRKTITEPASSSSPQQAETPVKAESTLNGKTSDSAVTVLLSCGKIRRKRKTIAEAKRIINLADDDDDEQEEEAQEKGAGACDDDLVDLDNRGDGDFGDAAAGRSDATGSRPARKRARTRQSKAFSSASSPVVTSSRKREEDAKEIEIDESSSKPRKAEAETSREDNDDDDDSERTIFVDDPFVGPSDLPEAEGDEACRESDEKKEGVAHVVSSGEDVGLGKKILVFAHHHPVLDEIENVLIESKVSYVRVDGKTTAKRKADLLHLFQQDNNVDVALLSITACGTGLNLTKANVAIFAELYWSPGVVFQAEDRIHRFGQQSSEVRIIYVLARNTADDIVFEQIQRKNQVLDATIGGSGDNGRMLATKSGKGVDNQARLDGFGFAHFDGKSQQSPAASTSAAAPTAPSVGITADLERASRSPTKSSAGASYSTAMSPQKTAAHSTARTGVSSAGLAKGQLSLDQFAFVPGGKSHAAASLQPPAPAASAPSASSSSSSAPRPATAQHTTATKTMLTAEQISSMERNRQEALRRLEQTRKRAAEQAQANPIMSASSSASPFSRSLSEPAASAAQAVPSRPSVPPLASAPAPEQNSAVWEFGGFVLDS